MITTDTVTVKRTSMWSIGVKNWYVFQDDQDNRYQRWSYVMDSTDEVLMLLQVGDVVTVTFLSEQHVNGGVKRTITAIELL